MPILHLLVAGRVQGVGFRWFVRRNAEALGLAGWVRNAESGDVEVAARGDESQLAALMEAIGRGPSGAYVTAVHRVPAPADVDYPVPFTIDR
jgi:acylphosphatase